MEATFPCDIQYQLDPEASHTKSLWMEIATWRPTLASHIAINIMMDKIMFAFLISVVVSISCK